MFVTRRTRTNARAQPSNAFFTEEDYSAGAVCSFGFVDGLSFSRIA